jgi:hypothetical protein
MRPLKISEYGNASFRSVLVFLVLSLIYAARNLICEKDVTFYSGNRGCRGGKQCAAPFLPQL